MGSALYQAKPSSDAWLCDLAGRLAFAHRLGPDLFAFTVGLSDNGAVLLLAGGLVELTSDQRERLELTVNILLRLEWRLRADRTEMLAWLERRTSASMAASHSPGWRQASMPCAKSAAPSTRQWCRRCGGGASATTGVEG